MSKPNISLIQPSAIKNSELSWFSTMVERGREAPFTEIVTVTPAIAERLLERNESNRNISEAQVSAIAKDIVSGFWQLNGETIIVSKDGFLNDGQNRLAAVIRSGMSVRTAMMFGVSRESRFSVDMGRQRTSSDFMAMNGVKNAHVISSIVALYELYKAGIYHRNFNVHLTKQDIVHAYERKHKDFDRAASVVASSKLLRSFGASSVGTAYVILRDVNSRYCDTFFDGLADGAGLERGSAILSLRNRLSNREKRLAAHEKLELILRGWNAWMEGRINVKAPPIVGSYPKVAR